MQLLTRVLGFSLVTDAYAKRSSIDIVLDEQRQKGMCVL